MLPPDVGFRPGLKTQSSVFSSTGVILHPVDPTYSFTETASLRYSSCLCIFPAVMFVFTAVCTDRVTFAGRTAAVLDSGEQF